MDSLPDAAEIFIEVLLLVMAGECRMRSPAVAPFTGAQPRPPDKAEKNGNRNRVSHVLHPSFKGGGGDLSAISDPQTNCTGRNEKMIKLIGMIKRKPGMTRGEFSRYWKEVHADVALRNMPGIVRYVQNHPVWLNDREPAWDGVVELWFEDLESFRRMSKWYVSEEGKILRDDEDRFIDRSKTINIISEEVVMKQGGV
jgi:uncharacterized protein (TIGR02118 family)